MWLAKTSRWLRRRGRTAETQVQLGLLQPTLPGATETLFWSSDFFERVARDKDNLTLYIHVFHELLFLFRVCAEVPAAVRGTLRRNCANCLILNLLHVALRFMLPQDYGTCRWIFVIHRRLYYTLGYISNVQAIANVAARPHTSKYSLTAADFDSVFSYQRLLPGSTISPATLLRSLLIGTCALWNLIHALPFPSPFVLEIPIQLTYLWASYYYIAQLATSYFSAPRFVPAATSLCHSIATLAQPPWLHIPLPPSNPLPATPPTPTPTSAPTAAPPHICDTPQRTWVLTLFLQVFLGFLVTLYLSYVNEYTLKARFLRRLRSPRATPAHATTSSRPLDATTTYPVTNPAAGTTTPVTNPATNPPAGTAPTTTTTTPAVATPTPPTPKHHPLTQTLPPALEPNSKPPTDTQATPTPTPQTPPRNLLNLLHSCCLHLLAMWLLAAVAWNLVVACRTRLARTLTLVHFPGANHEWYWHLMCGGDTLPCCPTVQ